jgi:D-glycero-D-manno-heptose 1,7-bisphosphate phosphatase
MALAARGHGVTLIAPPGEPSLRELPGAGVAFHPLRIAPRALSWNRFGVWRALRARPPHALIAMDSLAAEAAGKSRLLRCLPHVFLQVLPETTPTPGTGSSTARPVPGRSAEKDHLTATEWDVSRARMGIRIDAEQALPDRTAARRSLRLPRTEALVLVVGDFESGSGHEMILAAWGALLRRRAATASAISIPTLVFLGSGPQEHELRALSQELEMRERILWLGAVPDARPYLHAADLLLVVGSRPAAAWQILAGQACGVPVIALDAPAYAALIDPNRTGLLISPGDAAALTAAVDGLLLDPSLAAALGAAGRASAVGQRSHAALACEFEGLVYARLLRRLRWATTAAGRRALFADRDGTLVFNEPYNADPSKVRLEPEVGPALRIWQAAGAAVVVVSNQSAVARGRCTETDVRATNQRLQELLREAGVHLDGVYYCPHHPDFGPACACRKPAPGMLLQAAAELGLDLAGSVTVGDAERDLEAGRRAGTRALAYRGPESKPPSAAREEMASSVITVNYTNWLELIRDELGRAWGNST